jgi:hypothetical protein
MGIFVARSIRFVITELSRQGQLWRLGDAGADSGRIYIFRPSNDKANLPGPLQEHHIARNWNAAPVKLSDWFAGAFTWGSEPVKKGDPRAITQSWFWPGLAE